MTGLVHYARALAERHKLVMIFIVGEPSYERAPSFLIELVTFLFAIAFVTAVFGKDDMVFVKWKQAFADGNVLSTFSGLFAGAVL